MADPVGIASLIYTLVKDVYSEYKKGVINIPGCADILQSYITLVEEIDNKQQEQMQESSYVRDQLNKCKELLERLKELLIQKGDDRANARSKSGAKLVAELKESKNELLKAIPLMENDVICRLIQCKDGNKFWKSNFGDASEVRFSALTRALRPKSVSHPENKAYRVFFPTIQDQKVSVRDFAKFAEMLSGNVVNCSDTEETFDSLSKALYSIQMKYKLTGPIWYPDAEMTTDPSPAVMESDTVSKIEKIANKWNDEIIQFLPYFHGAVDRSHLDELFKGCYGLREGCFLLRYSSNADNTAAFSFINDGQLRSISIKCRCKDKPEEGRQETLV